MSEALASDGSRKAGSGIPGGKAAATRIRLLDAAARELGQRGYAGTRLTDIGEAAGVQAPAIYYHFSNKEELAGEVLREGLSRARQFLLDSLSAHKNDSPLARLSVAIAAHLRLATEQSDYAAAASLRQSGEMPVAVQKACRPEEIAFARVWKELLTEAKEAGLLRDDLEVRTAQIMLLGALNAIGDTWKPSRGRVDEIIHGAQTLLLNGLSAEAGAQGY